VYSHKKVIEPNTKGQSKYIETMLANDLTFCIGPAGTGKTYLAVAIAVSMLKKKQIRRIPLAFMRGRTLNEAVIICDEAQNTSALQMLMVLTRLGHGSKMIITGDITQIDLEHGQKSGMVEAIEILRRIKGIGYVGLTQRDIVRHRLVQNIVQAYKRRTKAD
jgi:phosphate starvation-inducible PhoH-like protein